MQDIIVIGASAGGTEPLLQCLASLPAGLPAAIFVIVHVPSWHTSELPAVINRKSKLPATHAESGQPIEMRRIYVAPPDHHLLIENGNLQLWRGPKESRQRPAINASFRSAAVHYGPRVAGVVLSGAMDDGAAGLWWVKRFGGVAIVQDPDEALFSDMPCAALQYVPVDYVSRTSDLGPLLAGLALDEGPSFAPPEALNE